MAFSRAVASTSVIIPVWLADTSGDVGAGLTGLVFNTTGLVAYYIIDNATAVNDITLSTMTEGTYTSGGFLEVNPQKMPGKYWFCPPDAAFASGKVATFFIQGAADLAPKSFTVDLYDRMVADEIGTVTSGTGSDFNATGISEGDTFWQDSQLEFITGPLAGQAKIISTYTKSGLSSRFTFDESFSLNPTVGDQFRIRIGHWHPVTQIADTVLGRNAAGGSDGGKTVAYYLQGGLPKIVMSADGLTVDIYGADGVTIIATSVAITRLATTVGGVRNLTPP